MTSLTIMADDRSGSAQTFRDYHAITRELNAVGVLLEKWAANQPLPQDADQLLH